MSPLLKVAKIAITHLSLCLSQNQQNFQARENSLGQLKVYTIIFYNLFLFTKYVLYNILYETYITCCFN